MTAAILSAGPSLLDTWVPAPMTGVETFAVNRALLVADADWLVAGDRNTFRLLGDRRPRLGAYYSQTPRDGTGWGELVDALMIPGVKDLERPWQWSIQLALAAAVHRGHITIRVFGVDHAGNADASGTDCDSRSDERWARERIDWQTSVDWALRRGVTVIHVHPVRNP